MTEKTVWETGCSTSFFHSISEEIVRDYAAAGITQMEISLPPTAYASLDFCNIKRWAQTHHVGLWSLHLPFNYEINIAHPEKSVSDLAVVRHSELIKRAGEAGVRYFVVHPSSEPIAEEQRQMLLARASENLRILCEAAASVGAVIAVEDLPRSCLGNHSTEILYFLEQNPTLRVCFDTNHLTNEHNIDFLREVGDKIVTVHISDYDFIDERHALPGEGKIDWQELIATLKQSGYHGAFLYEVSRTAAPGRRIGKDLTLLDLRQNHIALEAGKIQ